MSSKYYDSSGKEVFDRDVAEATDLNTINLAVDIGFEGVFADIGGAQVQAEVSKAWADNDQGDLPNPVEYGGAYSSRANAEESKAWASGTGGVDTGADGVTTISRSSREYSEDAATNAILTSNDVDLTNADVLLTNADVVLTNADVVLTNTNVTTTEEYRDKANEWADFPEDMEVEPGKYSALHWAAKADEVVNTNIVFENPILIVDDYEISNGRNGMSAGPITLDTGVTVTVPSGSTWTVV